VPRIPAPFVIGLLIVGVLAGAAVRIDYAARYQPIVFEGGSFGPASDGWKPVSDGFATTRWLLTAKPGTTSTFAYAITNSGADPVTIYDVPASPNDWIYESHGWSPVDEPYEVHQLPVVLHPHQAVEFLFSIRKPVCPGPGGRTEIGAIPIFYRAFGFSHMLLMPLSRDGMEPIEVCWS
jgi:hypothetical protein